VLLRIVRPVVSGAARIAGKLGDTRVTRHLGWQEESVAKAIKADLDTMGERVERVLRQTRVRVCRGITDWPGKLLSLFVPRTAVIRKGKAHKPNEFGRLIDIVEVENGIVSDYQVLDGNPDDGSLLLPALRRHQQRFGRVPHLVATDRGFWSAKNERDAQALGVKRVAIPATGKLARTRLRLQRSRWFRQAQRWRAAGEGRIGTLKNVFGMDRCMYKDADGRADDAMERWVGWCVFANNLVCVARALRRQEADGNQSRTTARQSDQAAA
jgi:IS5 family transposase